VARGHQGQPGLEVVRRIEEVRLVFANSLNSKIQGLEYKAAAWTIQEHVHQDVHVQDRTRDSEMVVGQMLILLAVMVLFPRHHFAGRFEFYHPFQDDRWHHFSLLQKHL